MDDLVLPNDHLELGDEIARGANGAVRKAKLFGMVVCAKVRCRCGWGAFPRNWCVLALDVVTSSHASPAPPSLALHFVVR
jgi:hypothetical protein